MFKQQRTLKFSGLLLSLVLIGTTPTAAGAEKERIAVVDFEVYGDMGVTDVGKIVPRLLLSEFQDRFELVTRTQLQALLQEKNLQMTDLAGTDKLGEYGKLLPVKYLVVGEVMKGADYWITAEFVEVGPGIIRSPRKVSAGTYRELEGKIGLLGKLLSMSEKEYHEWQLENEPSAPLALAMLPPPPPETAGAVGKPIADVLGTVDARYRLAVLKQTRALDRDRLMTATEDPKQQAELRAEAAKLYAEAANLFAGIAADLAPVVREQAGGANQQQILETYLLARAQTGWTHFYIGQLFSRDPKDKAKMTNEYAEAQDAFESFLRDYPNYLISLWIQCGLGMAYRSLGETEKAGDLFRRVVMRRRGQDVNPIRYQAYFWVVETYRLATRYDDAIRMANRFIAEIGEKSDSPIAQAIKLEKAEAYADEAEQYRRADRLAEARAGYMKAVAIMDILIREGGQNTAEAQKLLEQWRRALLDMD